MVKFKKPSAQAGGKLRLPQSASPSPETAYPTFSLRYLDPDYCLSLCDQEEKAAFAEKIRILSKKSWTEIDSSGRHGVGYEKIARTSIRRPIPSHVGEDVRIIAFRFCGLKPMLGYRSGATFFIIWFDRSFTLYRHD